MRNRLFLALLIAAIFTWGVALWRTGMFKNNSAKFSIPSHVESRSESLLKVERDPFRGAWSPSDTIRTKPQVKPGIRGVERTTPTSPEDGTVPVPRLVGVLGGEPPMAILGMDGRTEMVHPGSIVFGWKVVTVASAGVELERNGNRRQITP